MGNWQTKEDVHFILHILNFCVQERSRKPIYKILAISCACSPSKKAGSVTGW